MMQLGCQALGVESPEVWTLLLMLEFGRTQQCMLR